MGFGNAYAPVRCAHPSFWAHEHAKRDAARPHSPSIAASLLLIHPQKNKKINCIVSGIQIWAARIKGFPETKCFTSGPNSDCQLTFIFPLDHRDYSPPLAPPMHPSKLRCTLLSFGTS